MGRGGAEIRIRVTNSSLEFAIREMIGQIHREDASPGQIVHPDLAVVGHVGQDVSVTCLDFIEKVLDRGGTADVEGSIDRAVGGIRSRQGEVIAGRKSAAVKVLYPSISLSTVAAVI